MAEAPAGRRPVRRGLLEAARPRLAGPDIRTRGLRLRSGRGRRTTHGRRGVRGWAGAAAATTATATTAATARADRERFRWQEEHGREGRAEEIVFHGGGPHFAALRANFTSASARGWPSTSRSVDRQTKLFASTNSYEFVAPPVPPSGRTPLVPTTHFLPSLCQKPSPNPPWESKVHDRIRLLAPSQPTRSVTSSGSIPSRFTM